MRRIVSSLLIALIGLAWLSATASGDVCADDHNQIKNDGRCWNTLTETEKISIVRGIWVGASVRSLADRLINEQNFYMYKFDHAGIPLSTTIEDITEYIDELYSFPVNREIDWEHAYLLAALYVRDDDENDRLSLLRFLRDYNYLPSSATIVEVLDANLLIINTEIGHIKFRLAGISNEGLSDQERLRVRKFIDGLATSSYSSCDKAQPTNFMISYTDEFFSDDDNLTGYLSTYSVTFCMNGKQAVPISVLSGGNQLLLNSFIISNGLAMPQVISDKQWTKDRRLIRQFWISINPEKAKQQSLYLYGGNTHPYIEMIVNANRQ